MGSSNRFLPSGGGRLNPLDLGQGDWQIDGVPVIVSAADLNALSGGGGSPQTLVYVDEVGGNDATGTGSIQEPYKTISAALGAITNNASTKPYSIILATGVYTELNLALKPWVNIEGQNSILTVTNVLTCHASFTTGGGKCLIKDFAALTLTAGMSIDFSSAANAFLSIKNVILANSSTWTFTGNPSGKSIIKLAQIQNLFISPTLSATNCSMVIQESNVGGITFTNSGVNDCFLALEGNIINGDLLTIASSAAQLITLLGGNLEGENITIRSTSTGQNQLLGTGNIIFKDITLDGVNSFIFPDSLPSIPILMNGAIAANVQLISLSDGILANFTPTSYTPVDDSVNGHLRGINAAIGNEQPKIKSFRTISASFSVSKGIDLGNVIYCTNVTPIDIFNFDNGGNTTPIGWTTTIIVDPAADLVNIKTNGDPSVINLTSPGQTHILTPGQVATLTKIAEFGGNTYYLINGAEYVNQPLQTIFVSPTGIDNDIPTGRTGTGTYANPYATIEYAINQITDASSSKIYSLVVTPGVYNESTFTLKPFVYLHGINFPKVNVSGVLTLDAAFGSGAPEIILNGINFNFAVDQTLDFSSFTGIASILTFNGCQIETSSLSTINFNVIGDGAALLKIYNVENYGVGIDWNITNINVACVNNVLFNLNVTNTSNTANIYFNVNTTELFSITCTQTGTAVINAFFTDSVMFGLTLDSTGNTVKVDSSSWTTPTLLGGATLALYTPANAIKGNFTPTNYTPTDSSVKGHLEGVDAALAIRPSFVWNTLGVGPISMAANNGYINKVGSPNVFVLPSTFNVGDVFKIIGNAGSWQISQQTGQKIYYGNTSTTITTGKLSSTSIGDCVELVGVTANTELQVLSTVGNLSTT